MPPPIHRHYIMEMVVPIQNVFLIWGIVKLSTEA